MIGLGNSIHAVTEQQKTSYSNLFIQGYVWSNLIEMVEEKLILDSINSFVFSFNDRFSVLAELYVFLQINCM
jgi:hypothetical protein